MVNKGEKLRFSARYNSPKLPITPAIYSYLRSAGIVPGFSKYKLAYPYGYPSPAQVQLSQWFSSARMSRYADHPSPETLYLWNTHLTKTYLADIEHLEVLLRNSIHNALTGRYGEGPDPRGLC